MIRLSTKIQLLAFLLITVVGIAYVGASYIGINPFKRPYTVHLRLPSTGGVYTNADVAERGVVIGRVGAIHLAPAGAKGADGKPVGVIADLKINHGEKIPVGGLTAKVTDLSAVGEQYVELESTSDSEPYLAHGATIQATGTIPVDDAVILRNLEQLLGSVNVHDLSTVVSELGKGFNDLGPSLQKLIDNGNLLTEAAVNALPQTKQLINDGKTVLDTQRDVAGELKSFASSFANVTGVVSGKDAALRTILDDGSAASAQLNLLLKDNEGVLPELLTNLNTFTGIQNVRLPYTRALLELYPAIVADSFYALPTPKNGISTARFGLVTNLGPGCSSGYSSTTLRSNKPKDWGGAANLSAFCSGNNKHLDDQHIDIRGARHVPRPAGDKAQVTNADPYSGPHYGQAFPGSGKVGSCGTPTCPGSTASAERLAASQRSTVIAAPYNPSTGIIQGLDGKLYELGLNGPLAPVFGSSSYTWLLLAPTMR